MTGRARLQLLFHTPGICCFLFAFALSNSLQMKKDKGPVKHDADNSFSLTFTYMYLADAFIQSDLQCIQAIHFLSVHVFPGNRTHNLCVANAMLYHWATGTLTKEYREKKEGVKQITTRATKNLRHNATVFLIYPHPFFSCSPPFGSSQTNQHLFSLIVRLCRSFKIYTYSDWRLDRIQWQKQ